VGVGTTNPVGLFTLQDPSSNKNGLTILPEQELRHFYRFFRRIQDLQSVIGNVGIAIRYCGLLNVSGTMEIQLVAITKQEQ